MSPRQRASHSTLGPRLLTYLKELATSTPNSTSGTRYLVEPSGEIFHLQLPTGALSPTTEDFITTYADNQVLNTIPLDCQPVFFHLDWDLELFNLILYPNLDGVAGVIDWKRACFFPGSRSESP